MKAFPKFSILFISCCFLVDCKSVSNTMENQTVVRDAVNTPDYFIAPANIVFDGKSCINPMLDPRNGNELILLSSSNGLGKYDVPDGTYGVEEGEALLLDCSNGSVKGIVKQ